MDVVLMLAQAAPQRGNLFTGLMPIVMLLAVFYFIMILPQRREAKAHAEMVSALKRGDTIVTGGGLVGEIVGLTDDRLQVKTGTSTVVVERARVARLVPSGTA